MINFKNLTIFLVLIGFLSVTHAVAMDDEAGSETPGIRSRTSCKNLKAIGKSYVTFLQKVGQSDTPVTEEDGSSLFASQCTKKVNGKVLWTLSSDQPAQLNSVRKDAGKWTIETLQNIPSSEEGACTLLIKWKAKNLEKEHITMKILFVDEMEKIYLIDEVYNECL